MAISNTKVFPKHLDRDVSKIFWDKYTVSPVEYTDIAKVEMAPPGNHYTEAALSGLGHLREKEEGAVIETDQPVEGNEKTIYYTAYALGFFVTREMVKDDLHQNFAKMSKKLGKSAAIKPDVVFFNHVFNNGFDSSTSNDGQYIFDTDHTNLKSSSTYANEPATPGALSETTLQAAFEYFWGLTDDQGMPINSTAGKLVIPYQETWTMEKLRKTGLIVGSANNDINTVNPSNGVVGWTAHISRHLTDTDAWFLMGDNHDARLLWKEKPVMESADDIYTGNALFTVYERFGVAVFDAREMYGNPGS